MTTTLATFLSATACVSSQVRLAPPKAGARLSVHKLLVAPFVNLSDNPTADQIVGDAFITALAGENRLKVIDATKAVSTAYAGAVDRSRAVELGKATGADAVLFGSILEYSLLRSAPRGQGLMPAVGIAARLVSVASGEVAWAGSVTMNPTRLFSVDDLPPLVLAEHAVRILVDDLAVHVESAGSAVETKAAAESAQTDRRVDEATPPGETVAVEPATEQAPGAPEPDQSHDVSSPPPVHDVPAPPTPEVAP